MRIPVDLETRLRPQQQRARQSVDLILSSAAALLDEVGLNAFNTNLLADRAGIRVRTIYRYFPNKFAILAELARRIDKQVSEVVEGFATLADPAHSLQQGLDSLWSKYLKHLAGIPGHAAVRHACRIYPELEPIKQQIHSNLSNHLEMAIKKRGVKLKPTQRRLVAVIFIETASAILDYAETVDPKSRNDIIKELQQMQHRYLAPYF